MLGVGGFSLSLGIGMAVGMLGLTEKAGSRKDSLNFPSTRVPLNKDKNKNSYNQRSS